MLFAILQPFQLVSAVCSAVVEQEAARFPLLELPDDVLSHLMLVADPEAAMGLGSACIRLNHILRDCRLEVKYATRHHRIPKASLWV